MPSEPPAVENTIFQQFQIEITGRDSVLHELSLTVISVIYIAHSLTFITTAWYNPGGTGSTSPGLHGSGRDGRQPDLCLTDSVLIV